MQPRARRCVPRRRRTAPTSQPVTLAGKARIGGQIGAEYGAQAEEFTRQRRRIAALRGGNARELAGHRVADT